MPTDDKRLRDLEDAVSGIRGALDRAKIAFGILASVAIGGFAILITLNLNLSARIAGAESKVDGLATKLTEEFRNQRADQSAQISALANVVTAVKQQAPQVILVPAPTSKPGGAP